MKRKKRKDARLPALRKVIAPLLSLGLLARAPGAAVAAPGEAPARRPVPARAAEPAPRAPAAPQDLPADPPAPRQRAGAADARPAPRPAAAVPALKGRTVEDVRILGNTQVAQAVIRNVIRTQPGEPYDPATVEEDYQRIYDLRKFANVEARVEPTSTGVVVVFVVTEQRQITDVRFLGNQRLDTPTLRGVVAIGPGEAIDPFRISLARSAIEDLYKERNYPFAHVNVPQEPLAERGELTFEVVEGPNVKIRNVEFKGNDSFTDDRLKGLIKSSSWVFVFRSGRFDAEQVEQDVAALRRFYEGKGFFDVRVGRKLYFSPDYSELQINFLVEEGQRYVVDKVSFEGNVSLATEDLRSRLRLLEGRAYDNDLLQRDNRQIVRAYSPFGFIYQPQSNDPDYLRIEARPVFKREAGRVELVYRISEGKPFRVGRVIVKGNPKSQDKLVRRELRFGSGELYNAGEVQDATDRLRGTPYFGGVSITPIGDDPNYRDLLVEVQEARTASFNVGAGVNSNGGVGGNITFEQRNFDIGNFPDRPGDVFTDRAFVGAGQSFRATFEPGTEQTNGSLRFTEPWLFDQPYSFTGELYLRDRVREHYDDERLGGRVSFGKRFNYVYSGAVSFRYENIEITDIEDEEFRAPEILAEEGDNTLSAVGLQFRRDTTNPGFFPYRGTNTVAAVEFYGLAGGDYEFQKFSLAFDGYHTVREDLLDRRTVLGFHGNFGYITGDSVFFERFYGGGIGSVRGFRFRGISPRSGRDEDPVGGDFALTGSVELNFPLAGETLRGVTFVDGGTVEEDFDFGTIRTSVGAGIRLVLPFLGQAPLAVDFAVPVTKDDQDDTQLISFSFGFVQ